MREETRPARLRADGLAVRYDAPGPEPLRLDPKDGVLGAVVYGRDPAPVADGLPVVRVECPPLAGSRAAEVWTIEGPVTTGRRDPCAYAAGAGVLFAHASVPAGRGEGLDRTARALYRELLDLATEGGFPHLYRAWNYVPRINEDEDGLERYRRFCRGRALAFQDQWGAYHGHRLPAATGVGCDGETLTVYLLAGRETPQHHENPRQTSAYRYPPSYGPASPSFARATTAPASLGGAFLVAGTASVVGHESAHPGDVDAQLVETMRNIEVLLDLCGPDAVEPSLSDLALLKVYLRRAEDLARVDDALRRIAPGVPTLYLRADICRRELLLEIEAVRLETRGDPP